MAARELYAGGPCRNPSAGKRAIVSAVKTVARQLGNRPATCRKYYVHAAVLDAYSTGFLFPVMQEGEKQNGDHAGLGLHPEEYSVMVIIAGYQQKLAKVSRAA